MGVPAQAWDRPIEAFLSVVIAFVVPGRPEALPRSRKEQSDARRLRGMLRDPEGKTILIWATAQILIGTLVDLWMEGWAPVDALYSSVVTLATVGFGDLHPTTTAAKLLTVLYVLLGLGVSAAFICELNKHRSSVITRLVPPDEASDPGEESERRWPTEFARPVGPDRVASPGIMTVRPGRPGRPVAGGCVAGPHAVRSREEIPPW